MQEQLISSGIACDEKEVIVLDAVAYCNRLADSPVEQGFLVFGAYFYECKDSHIGQICPRRADSEEEGAAPGLAIVAASKLSCDKCASRAKHVVDYCWLIRRSGNKKGTAWFSAS